MAALGSTARLGAGDLLVAEADESDGSFLRLSPTIAVITNIDPEHLDYYGSEAALQAAFLEFAQKVPFYGLGVLCLDHPTVQDLLPRIARRHVTYGLSPQANYWARGVRFTGITTYFTAFRREESLGEFCVRIPGQHNVLNTLAAIAVADELEVPLDVMKDALATFHGVARRFSIVAEVGGVTLVDDYGHHPAEIIATLDAARNAYDGRILVAFQPHRYSRTQLLFEEFSRAFNQADLLFVTDIYPAGEAPIAAVSAERLVEAIALRGHHAVHYVSDRNRLVEDLSKHAAPGDVVIALGAGDINRILEQVGAALAQRSAGGGA
jgi:UDP-N-acetylmuramate--alanine ligase